MALSTNNQLTVTGWTRRRALLFLLSMFPLLALLLVLAWGQLRTGGNPGGLLEYNNSGEQSIAVRPAPLFSGIDLVNGGLINNGMLRGQIVMLDFWSSWCLACRAEAVDLASVYTEYMDRPVEFIGIAIWDDVGDILRHIDRYSIHYPNLLDDQGTTAVHYGVRGVPEKVFLDQNGTIVRKLTGPVTPNRLREVLDSLLAL
jgi:thiol-disulfide isomerase/thioredoxin